MNTIAECRGVSFSYGRHPVLSDISFCLSPGITGLLGVNGAGKSTLIRLLATLRRPSSGSVEVAGQDVTARAGSIEARRYLGYLPQSFEVMNFSTVEANVEYAAWAHGVDEQNVRAVTLETLKAVGLDELAKRRVRTLSGGQRQRLGIACATAHKPELLLLDEPTVGVDPLQRDALRGMIAELGKSSAILLSTHLVEDVARLADRVLIMDCGRLVFDGSVDDLVAKVPTAVDRTVAIETAFRMMAS
ncbi:ABC transporter ATP-binding protein [Bifidobacterium sp. ESL0784]|uniref:ABC transporter ATP-binding protein n=1 Tax=Bifidobacterium sp. ESL0784 TaxID=2983231 RepID=UPI0023F82A09|nr:ABC transporter ATP-binding protein [Bifidobacterium sp. ESL0784]MDF7640183.1 ABC transporter ATP-binding protein [Bifidobacterium sp. ESL0784]